MKAYRATGVALLIFCVGARAQDGQYTSPTEERVRLSLGVMDISASTDVRVDGTSGTIGTLFNAEDDLGQNHGKIGPKFQAMVRVEERHRLRFDYFILDRTANRQIDQPIQFGDAQLFKNDLVSSELDLQIIGINYGYSFVHHPTFELAGTIGVSIIDFTARARVRNPTHSVDIRQDEAGMFPTVGLDATWVLSKRFYLDGRVQYLKVSFDHFDGSLGFFELAALYRWRSHVSVGLGYNQVRAKLTSSQINESGFFDFNTKGPEIFVRMTF